jgi:hypothetical protein
MPSRFGFVVSGSLLTSVPPNLKVLIAPALHLETMKMKKRVTCLTPNQQDDNAFAQGQAHPTNPANSTRLF